VTYSIRPMAKEDIGQVNEIDREAFPTQWPPPNYNQEMKNKIAHYLVAYDNTKILSGSPPVHEKQPNKTSWLFPWKKHALAIEIPPPEYYIVGFAGIWMLTDEAHITNLAVRGEYRRKGLGELLLIALIDLADELKARFMTLEVRASNLVAQSLYSKNGFVEMGVRRGYYIDNREDAIIMSTDALSSPAFKEHIGQLREALKKKLG
jgi:ribosomal-protein-alanine N-acetyltransferase